MWSAEPSAAQTATDNTSFLDTSTPTHWLCRMNMFSHRLRTDRLCLWTKLNLVFTFNTKAAESMNFDFLSFFVIDVVVVVFIFLCIQFMFFHQNTYNGFLQHTCSPPAQCVFWLGFVSFMSRHTQCLSFCTDILHAWKMCLLSENTRQRKCE